MNNTFPLSLKIDFPDRPLNRLTSFFRAFTIIPIGFLAGLFIQTLPPLTSFTTNYNTADPDLNNYVNWISSGGTDLGSLIAFMAILAFMAPVIMFIGGFISNMFNPIVLMLVFRHKYPRWWYDYYVNLIGFFTRVISYATLLTDIYPSTDEDQNVHIDVAYPDVLKDLNRGLPLIKWFLAIPHYIVFGLLVTVSCICVILAWFVILFTARIPKGLFDFISGTIQYGLRISAYAVFHFTDKYPPFSFE